MCSHGRAIPGENFVLIELTVSERGEVKPTAIAAADILKKTAEQSKKASKALRTARKIPEDVRKVQEAKEMELDASLADCEFEMEVYLRAHDSEPFATEQKISASILQEFADQPIAPTVQLYG